MFSRLSRKKNFNPNLLEQIITPDDVLKYPNGISIASLPKIPLSCLLHQFPVEPFIIASQHTTIRDPEFVTFAMILLSGVSQYSIFYPQDTAIKERLRASWELANTLSENCWICVFNGGNNSISDWHIQAVRKEIHGYNLTVRNDLIP